MMQGRYFATILVLAGRTSDGPPATGRLGLVERTIGVALRAGLVIRRAATKSGTHNSAH